MLAPGPFPQQVRCPGAEQEAGRGLKERGDGLYLQCEEPSNHVGFPPAVASDRISIHSMGHMTPALSPQNLISCDTRNQRGCSGGRIDGAWWYLRRRG